MLASIKIKHLFHFLLILSGWSLSGQELDSSQYPIEVEVFGEAPEIHGGGPAIYDTTAFYASKAEVRIINYSFCKIDSLWLGSTFIGSIGIGEIYHGSLEGQVKLCDEVPIKLNARINDERFVLDQSSACDGSKYYMRNESYTFYLISEWDMEAGVHRIKWQSYF